jgi:AraC-like DNA-binding protein
MSKSRIIKTNVETIIIPGASQEWILTQPAPNIHCMDDYKILIAGISHLTKGYLAERFPSYYNLILYCHQGTGCIEENGRTIDIHENEVLIAPTGITFSYHPTTPKWNISWIHLIDSPEWNSLVSPSLLVHKAQWGRQVTKLMESYIEEAGTRRTDSQHILKLYTETLVFYLKRELGTENPAVIEAREMLQKLWVRVHGSLQHKWSVEEMASSTGLCKTKLNRLCVKIHKTTPMNMVTAMRMERAAEMLSFTNYSLTMIADETGYENSFAFSKAFKRYAGICPKEYRNRQISTQHSPKKF